MCCALDMCLGDGCSCTWPCWDCCIGEKYHKGCRNLMCCILFPLCARCCGCLETEEAATKRKFKHQQRELNGLQQQNVQQQVQMQNQAMAQATQSPMMMVQPQPMTMGAYGGQPQQAYGTPPQQPQMMPYGAPSQQQQPVQQQFAQHQFAQPQQQYTLQPQAMVR
jgi:hypothetical protein